MLKVTKSESDATWIENNISTLNDGLVLLDAIPTRCDYYDIKMEQYLTRLYDFLIKLFYE